MKYLIFPLVVLGFGTAAIAQPSSAPKSYPPCSKSVTDECTGPSRDAAHHTAMRPASHHRMAAHHHKMAAHHHRMAARHHAHPMAPASRDKTEPKSS